jgi:hypothetical protein
MSQNAEIAEVGVRLTTEKTIMGDYDAITEINYFIYTNT